MSLREQLKRTRTVRGRRWTIRRDKSENLTEIKMIYNPQEYAQYKNTRKMYGDKALLKIIEKEYEKKSNNS